MSVPGLERGIDPGFHPSKSGPTAENCMLEAVLMGEPTEILAVCLVPGALGEAITRPLISTNIDYNHEIEHLTSTN